MSIKIIGDEILYNGYKVAVIDSGITPSLRKGFVEDLEEIEYGIDDGFEDKYNDLVDSLVDPSDLDGVIEDVEFMVKIKTKEVRQDWADKIISDIEYVQNNLRYCLDV